MKSKKDKFKFKDTINIIKKSMPYIKKGKKYIFLYAIALIIFISINIITPLFSAKLVLNITNGLLNKVIIVAGVILILELLRNLFDFIASIIYNKFYYILLNEIQGDLASETLKLDIREVDKHSSGVFIDRLTKDASELSEIFQMIMWYLSEIFTHLGVLGAIFIVSKIMFVYCVFVLFIIYWVEKVRIKAWFDRMDENKKIREENSGLVSELVRGIRDIKVLNSSKDFLGKMMKKIKIANSHQVNLVVSQKKYSLLSGSLKDISDFMFIILGIILIKTNHLSIDNMIVIYMYQTRIYGLLTSLTSFNEETKKFTLSSKRVFEIIDGKFKKEEFGKRHLNHVEGNFEFKNVTFGYEKNRPILNNLSFKVKANETVAFVGKSGGGKTTIFSLIDKLYTVKNGEITIDGININELDKDSIRDNISIITQSPYIFNFTIKENLKITKENATDEEIIEACKIAQLHDYIMTLPKKYDTLVGEGGLTLSGGQRQRLAIARALLKQTEIILFDEATSALDNETQKSVQKAINNMKGTYTILIIAHRLSTVVDADRLILINNGKVEAEGTHEELLKKSKTYRELYENELE